MFTLRDSVSLLSIVAIGYQGHHFLEAIDQRRLSTILTSDDAQFETLPDVGIDLLLVKTRPDHSKHVDGIGTVLIEHLHGYGWLHQGIIPYLQFSRGHDIVGEFLRQVTREYSNAIVRHIDFERDEQQVIVELRQLIEGQVDGEENRRAFGRHGHRR